MDHRAVEAGALQANKGAAQDRLEGQGMSAHPDDDLSFDALMEQFHQYEMEVDGHVTEWKAEEDEEENDRRRKHREERGPREDLLQSRAGREGGVSRAEIGTRGYDRRTSLREPRFTPMHLRCFASSMHLKTLTHSLRSCCPRCPGERTEPCLSGAAAADD
jgi:hypothetical protein